MMRLTGSSTSFEAMSKLLSSPFSRKLFYDFSSILRFSLSLGLILIKFVFTAIIVATIWSYRIGIYNTFETVLRSAKEELNKNQKTKDLNIN